MYKYTEEKWAFWPLSTCQFYVNDADGVSVDDVVGVVVWSLTQPQ